MGNPIDRTAKAELDLNLVNGVISDAPKLKANNDVLYDYVDFLNGQLDQHASASVIPHPDGSVTTAKIANSAITSAKIANNAVETAKIVDNAVTSAKIADQAVTSAKIAAGAVTSEKISSLAITTEKLANGAVTAEKLAADVKTNETINNVLIRSLEKDLVDRAINVRSFGAVGDGLANDTEAIKNAIEFVKENKGELFFPQGNYYVNDTILEWINSDQVVGFIIRGNGAKIIFDTQDEDKPLIKLTNVTRMVTRGDITFEAANEGKGIGFDLGEQGQPVTNFKAWEVYFRFFKIGVRFNYGWLNSLYSPIFRFNNTGIVNHSVSNALNVYDIISENNDTGVNIKGGNGVNFFGGTIESCRIGFQIDGGMDINIQGVYLEKNQDGHILAGTGEETVESLNIIGGNINFANPIVFDKVNTLHIRGWSGYRSNNHMIITENVKNYDIPYMRYYGSNNAHVSINVKDYETEYPFFSTDLREINAITNPTSHIYLGHGMNVRLTPVKGSFSLSYTDYLTAGKSIKYVSNPGETFSGVAIRFYFDEKDIVNGKICLVLRVKHKNTNIFRIYSEAQYYTPTGDLKNVQLYDSQPIVDVVQRSSGMYHYNVATIDLSPVINSSDFSSLDFLNVVIQVSLSQPSTGNEELYIDGFDLYNTVTPINPYHNKAHSLNAFEYTAKSIKSNQIVLSDRRIFVAPSPPSDGTFNTGDIVLASAPTAGGYIGWVYISGTWKMFGQIST